MSKKSIFLIFMSALILVSGGGYYWWQKERSQLPEYIASGNGRIESEMTQVATTAGGRIVEMLVKEGDRVEKGHILARMDTAELRATLARAEANLASLRESIAEAEAQIIDKKSALKFANDRLQRALPLVKADAISREEADRRQNERDMAKAALDVVIARRATLERNIDAAKAEMDRIKTLVDETVIAAPVGGRIQHRLAEPGEVLGPGGRLVSLLDLENVYMTIFLPTEKVGKIYPGSEARIVLDAFPQYVIPAQVSFVSSEAQFTPREVETRAEREKLMFRVKVAIPQQLLHQHIEKVRTGLPGVAYVMLDSGNAWPSRLAINIPQ